VQAKTLKVNRLLKFKNGDYDKVRMLIENATRLTSFREKVNRFISWQARFKKAILLKGYTANEKRYTGAFYCYIIEGKISGP